MIGIPPPPRQQQQQQQQPLVNVNLLPPPPQMMMVGMTTGTLPGGTLLLGPSGTPGSAGIMKETVLLGQNVPILVDYRLMKHNPFLAARFIFECGAKLEARPMTTATAIHVYHQCAKNLDNMKSFDNYMFAATSLYIGGKVEGQNIKLRDVINVAYATIHRNSLPLDLDNKYWSLRDSIIQTELLMMRLLKFDVNITHPHKFLVHYLKTLEEWIGDNPTARLSWSIVQDFYHDPSVISYPPQAVALAAMQLSMGCFGAQVPLCAAEGRNSFANIVYPDVKSEVQKEIQLKMLQVYETEAEILPKVAYREVANGK